ncbi:hypothetical protein AYI70_g1345 [Smittium culicis]|uniref:Uncharacterized protein n=1 Tax=Smittium culicis TaxID=133412 RepID=A0A1R1YCX7_9FUNG|nr:hypothetical protein AYI70_g8389 [Smittium culicis]OMJ24778.1 hypothetical protein AYI70_g1345 [Smittium culicis]
MNSLEGFVSTVKTAFTSEDSVQFANCFSFDEDKIYVQNSYFGNNKNVSDLVWASLEDSSLIEFVKKYYQYVIHSVSLSVFDKWLYTIEVLK